jgi:hypothetical protein
VGAWIFEPAEVSRVLPSGISRLEPPRDGKIAVVIIGNATQRGELWVPESANIGMVETMVGCRPEWASRQISVTRVGPEGHWTLRLRINKMTRGDKEEIKLKHGDVISFIWDRCFG